MENLPMNLNEMMLADAGMGAEEIDQSSFAIPRIMLLQPLSPIVADASDESGIRAGMFYNTATGEVYKEFDFIQAHFNRRYVRWSSDGSFRGEYLPAEIETNHVTGAKISKDGFQYTIHDELGDDMLVDCRVHYVLIKDPATGALAPAVINLTKTQIKHSKKLITMIRTAEFQAGGKRITPPSWALWYKATVGKEKNDRGQWFVWNFSRVGQVQTADEYQAGKALHDAVAKGEVQAKFEQEGTPQPVETAAETEF